MTLQRLHAKVNLATITSPYIGSLEYAMLRGMLYIVILGLRAARSAAPWSSTGLGMAVKCLRLS